MSSQIPGLYILDSESKGRGVFTSRDIPKGSIIESAPVIICSEKDRLIIHKTLLHDYYFLWNENECAIALGYGSLYNHSDKPNADFALDYMSNTIDFSAIMDIQAGEEIMINYQTINEEEFTLWFDVK
jgi:SET domain-containing protein